MARDIGATSLTFIRFSPLTGNGKKNVKKLILSLKELVKCADTIYKYKAILEKLAGEDRFKINVPWLTQKYREYFHLKYRLSYPLCYVGCVACTGEFSITPKGNLVPCFNAITFLKPEHGNFSDIEDPKLSLLIHSFKDILESDYFYNMYKVLHKSRERWDFDICKLCNLRESCFSCPTMRLLKLKSSIDICYYFEKATKEGII